MKKGKKNKKTSPFTLLIIPDNSSKAWSISFSKKKMINILVLLAGFLLSFFALGYLYFSGLNDIRHQQKFKAEIRNKNQTIRELEDVLGVIEQEKEDLNRKQRELRRLMGLNEGAISEAVPSRGIRELPNRGSRSGLDEGSIDRVEQIRAELIETDEELDIMLALARKKQKYFQNLPNYWPVSGEITSDFGMRKSPFSGKGESFHEGIDIANQVGSPVQAAAAGVVEFSGRMPVYGLTIIVNHGNGLQTKYSHNSQLLVKEGENVEKGQLLARMGSTGRSTGPHLHFAVLRNGNPIDPMEFLPQL